MGYTSNQSDDDHSSIQSLNSDLHSDGGVSVNTKRLLIEDNANI